MIELVNANRFFDRGQSLESVAILSVRLFFNGAGAGKGRKRAGFSGVRVEISPLSPLYRADNAKWNRIS
jgi:hypothetical protein